MALKKFIRSEYVGQVIDYQLLILWLVEASNLSDSHKEIPESGYQLNFISYGNWERIGKTEMT